MLLTRELFPRLEDHSAKLSAVARKYAFIYDAYVLNGIAECPRNKQTGEWESRTEWHRGIVFGPAEFAATLKRGAHVQIQGELRSRKYDKPLAGKKKIKIPRSLPY